MQTVISSILLINAGKLVIIITGLLTIAFLVLTWHLLNKTRRNYKRRSDETRFIQSIQAFSNFCSMHYRYAVQLFQHYSLKRGNEFDASAMINNSLSTVGVMQPGNFFREHAALLNEPKGPRVASVLMETLYALKSQTENMNEVWYPARNEYNEAVKDYYENIHDLSRICDELREYTKNKSYNKNVSEWITAYFDIFDQWFRNGARKDLSVLQSDIIEKIFVLNQQQPVHPFSDKTKEKAIRCELAFKKITDLDNLLCNKILQYIWAYKKATRITTVIGKHLVPVTHSNSVLQALPALAVARNDGISRKMLMSLGVLMIIATGFVGGFYSGNRQQRNPVPPAKPIIINKPVIDTVQKKIAVKPVDAVPAPKPTRFDSITVVSGLDISRYQGNLLRELEHLDTVHFIICKATQGTSSIDPSFKHNWERLRELDIIRGAYHFYMAKHDPLEQAEHFVKTVGPLADLDIPLVLDIEDGSIKNVEDITYLQEHLLIFLQRVEDQTGKKPIIYTSLSFANDYLLDTAFSNYPLWLAEYSKRRNPKLPATWKKKGHLIWQKDDSFTVKSQKVDFDVFNGNGAAFVKFLKAQ